MTRRSRATTQAPPSVSRFAVLLFDSAAGALFLIAAAIIGAGRVFIGAHYPADVLAGSHVELLTDPVLAAVWRRRPSQS